MEGLGTKNDQTTKALTALSAKFEAETNAERKRNKAELEKASHYWSTLLKFPRR